MWNFTHTFSKLDRFIIVNISHLCDMKRAILKKFHDIDFKDLSYKTLQIHN